MADPVSLALSIASCAAPAFKFSIAALHFILDMKNVPKDQKYLVLSLRLEEQRLYTWGDHVGLTHQDHEPISVTDFNKANEEQKSSIKTKMNVFGAHKGLVIDLLAQISVLFHDFQQQQKRHSKLTDIKSVDKMVDEDASEDAVSSEEKKSFIKRCQKINFYDLQGWKRLRWVSFDMAEYKELIRRFSSLNDSITGLLESKLQRDIASTTQDIYREVLQMATLQEQLKNIISAAHFGQQAHGSQEKGLRTLMELASFKAFYATIDNTEENISQRSMAIPITDIKVEESQLPITGDRSSYRSRAMGRYLSSSNNSNTSSQEVWIEWKPSQQGLWGNCPDTAQDYKSRANMLACLLNRKEKPKEFRVPYCLGYFDYGRYIPNEKARPFDPNFFGFVYAMPDNANSGTRPLSLRQLLGDSKIPKPDIADRALLAQTLASSLMYLHTVQWFGKSLRSDNIVFFVSAVSDDNLVIDYGNPIQAGFDYVTPVARNQYDTQAPDNDIDAMIYRHPESLGDSANTYLKSYDIYSLGLVFVELAFWMPIEDVLMRFDRKQYKANNPNWNDNDPEQLPKRGLIFNKDCAKGRPCLVRSILEKLLRPETIAAVGAEMGRIFKEVTMRCLKGGQELGLGPDDDETSPSIGAKLSSAYWEKVVRPLEEIRV